MFLKKGEKREPSSCPFVLFIFKSTSIGKSVVIKEETRRDIECYEDVDGVVLVGCQDKKDSKEIEYPACSVEVVPFPWGV